MLRPTLAALTALAAAALALPVVAVHAQDLPSTAAAPAWPPKMVQLIHTARPGGFFGYNGADLFAEQQVAERFSVPADGDLRLFRVSLWFMNNSDSQQADVNVSVQTDALDEGGDASIPSGHRIEAWTRPVATYGWTPVRQQFTSDRLPRLKAGHAYWVVAQSNAEAGSDPLWAFSKVGTQMSCYTDANGAWQACGEAAALTLEVQALPLTRP
ncbi:MAG TPA: hypothetical protein VH328_07235 [Burkholderiaceae bacterium]|jgi:hypothetical protein|nr:hypothetical protein [Burkholderiaceae bacterium]